ncbi:MAG: hypothetical protein KDA80_03515, partial [Planctomycetaceae bacterium]|nr:hypothetical protein [Planctomycetaceae bacterium]
MASSPSCTRNLTWSDRVRRWTSPLACVALFAASLFCPTTASAQPDYGDGAAYDYESDVDFSLPFDDHSGSVSAVPEPEDHGVGGYGVKGRAGHIVGDTVGRNDSITYFDMSPYAFFDDTMLFGEGRLFIANNGRVGGSAGLGLRRFFSEKNLIGGASFWYDRDDSRGPTFEQLGLSTEMLSEWLDWRTNIYFQIGQDLAITRERVENGTEMFVGQNIAFQRRTFAANTMQGMDMMFTVPVPGELPQRNNLELSAGWYMFEAPDYPIEDVYGWKLRLDGDILDRLSHMFVEYTSDATFKNNIIFGVDVNYWHTLESRPRLGRSQYNRMASWVRRNRTVTVTETSFLQAPELAINPVTGQPYLVYHVRNRPDGAL